MMAVVTSFPLTRSGGLSLGGVAHRRQAQNPLRLNTFPYGFRQCTAHGQDSAVPQKPHLSWQLVRRTFEAPHDPRGFARTYRGFDYSAYAPSFPASPAKRSQSGRNDLIKFLKQLGPVSALNAIRARELATGQVLRAYDLLHGSHVVLTRVLMAPAHHGR